MFHKPGPYILLISLSLILIFILGIRYGQSIEKTNKKVDFMLSIVPTQIPPTPTPISYQEYKSKKSGIKYTFPTDLEMLESTNSASVSFQLKK